MLISSASFQPAQADIEARTLQTTVVRVSGSGNLALIDAPGVTAPPPGRVILLRQDGKPVLGMRVVKLYPGTTEFAVKKVKTYGSTQTVSPSTAYEAVEKLGDIVPQPLPRLTAADQADLREIEEGMTAQLDELGDPAAPPPPPPPPASSDRLGISSSDAVDELGDPIGANGGGSDPELDGGLDGGMEPPPPPPPSSEPIANLPDEPGGPIPPPPSTATDPAAINPNDEDDIDGRLSGLEVFEREEFSPNYQWFTLGSGMFSAVDFDEAGTYYMGATARYQLDLGHRLLITEASVQDALSLEGGLGYYTITGYAEVDEDGIGYDSYRVMPIMGAVRYTLWFSETFGLFGYLGFTKNVVTVLEAPSNSLLTEDALVLLGANKTAIGAGAMFQVGPSWFARVDAGTDFLGVGVVLAF